MMQGLAISTPMLIALVFVGMCVVLTGFAEVAAGLKPEERNDRRKLWRALSWGFVVLAATFGLPFLLSPLIR